MFILSCVMKQTSYLSCRLVHENGILHNNLALNTTAKILNCIHNNKLLKTSCITCGYFQNKVKGKRLFKFVKLPLVVFVLCCMIVLNISQMNGGSSILRNDLG